MSWAVLISTVNQQWEGGNDRWAPDPSHNKMGTGITMGLAGPACTVYHPRNETRVSQNTGPRRGSWAVVSVMCGPGGRGWSADRYNIYRYQN